MPTCRDARWHTTPEEAEACTKHPSGKHFDGLSTVSRKRERTRRTASQQSSRSTTSQGTATPSPVPVPPQVPRMPTPPPVDHQNVDAKDLPSPQAGSVDVIPETPIQPPTGQGYQDVPRWIDRVEQEPSSVPSNNVKSGMRLPSPAQSSETPMCGGVVTQSPQPPHTPETEPTGPYGLQTPPVIDRPIKTISKIGKEDETGSSGNRDPSPTPTGPKPRKVFEDELPWYRHGKC